MVRYACHWRILPALLAGAGATVLVAWLGSLRPEPRRVTYFHAPGPIRTPEGPDSVTELGAWRYPGAAHYTSTSLMIRHDWLTMPTFVSASEIAPPWILARLSIPSDHTDYIRSVTVQGWPYRSLWSIRTDAVSRDDKGGLFSGEQRGGEVTLPLAWSRRLKLDDATVLCCYPTPYGFAADTGIFAVPWWTVLFLAPAARRARRRRRNRCAGCAYDRAGLPKGAACPECGRTQP